MSTVWLAMDETLGKQWAVKEILLSENPEKREIVVGSLVAEANLIKRLDHPAIPRIVDLVDEEGVLYVVMDFVEGTTLANVVASEGPQAEDAVAGWASQICDVLDYLHGRSPSIVFRDLKPSNVMLRSDGSVRLIDFGIATEVGTPSNSARSRLGTRGYAAPEQYAGESVDARSDIFGLGATMWALLTGERPPDDGSPSPLRQIRPEISVGMERVVARATEMDPADRFPGAAEMAYALERYPVDDDRHRHVLAAKWHAFVAACVASLVMLVLGIGFAIARNATLDTDFGHWMQIAEQSADASTAEQAYIKAAAARPGDAAPYLGLIERYRADRDFNVEEEAQFQGVVSQNISALEADKGSWASLSLEAGKLYWYYYDDGTNQSMQTDDVSAGYSRIRAASGWMHRAAEADGFSGQALAQTYAAVADFNSDIVPLIDEGSDAGLYAPYFARLEELDSAAADENTDVMRLQAANLTLDALRSYSRKFRADGLSKDELSAAADAAISLASSADATTEKLDGEKRRAFESVDSARQAISDAFVDVGVIA